MLPSETMIWQPEFTDKTLSRKPGAVHLKETTCWVERTIQMVNYRLISLALTGRSWQANWPNLATFFAYPTDIRKVIYTTNAIESLNSVIRHAIKKRKVFPTDDSVKKVVWLAIQSASRKWTMPLKDWRMAMSRFIIEFGDRLDGHF